MKRNLTYTQCGDYYVPDIGLAHTDEQILGKYGRMRRIFLEQSNPMLFNDMVMTETLFPHLWDIQRIWEKQIEVLMKELLIKTSPRQEKSAAYMKADRYGQSFSLLKAQCNNTDYSDAYPFLSGADKIFIEQE